MVSGIEYRLFVYSAESNYVLKLGEPTRTSAEFVTVAYRDQCGMFTSLQ